MYDSCFPHKCSTRKKEKYVWLIIEIVCRSIFNLKAHWYYVQENCHSVTSVNAFPEIGHQVCSRFAFRYDLFSVHRRRGDETREEASDLLIGLQSWASEWSDLTSSSHVRSSDNKPLTKIRTKKIDDGEMNSRCGSANIMNSSAWKRNLLMGVERSSSRQTKASAGEGRICSKNWRASRKLEGHKHRISLIAKTIRTSV